MNYNSECVCEAPRGGIPVAPTNTSEPCPPAAFEQFRIVSEHLLRCVDDVDKLSRFMLASQLIIDKREEDTVTGYLVWFARVIDSIDAKINDLNNFAR